MQKEVYSRELCRLMILQIHLNTYLFLKDVFDDPGQPTTRSWVRPIMDTVLEIPLVKRLRLVKVHVFNLVRLGNVQNMIYFVMRQRQAAYLRLMIRHPL